MIKFLKENYGNRSSSKLSYSYLKYLVNANERNELEFLRAEVARLNNMKGGVILYI